MPGDTDFLEKTKLLQEVEFLSGLTPSELEELAGDFLWRRFPEGTAIIEEGQESAGFYVIQAGRAEAVIDRSGNQPLIHKILGPGETFGEDDLFAEKPSTRTVRCLEDCQVLRLDPDHFAYMLMRWPHIYRNFVQKLHEQLNQVNIDLLKAKYREFVRTGLKVNQLKYEFYGLWGNPETTKAVEQEIDSLVKTKTNGLLIGEKGTGQQMMAWFVHKRRFGEAGPFIFLEGDKLDQQRGNPYYEIMDFPGKFSAVEYFLDISEGGTLFIRDINLMSPRMQETLAKALEVRGYSGWIVGTLTSPTAIDRIIPRLKKYFPYQYTLKPLRHRKEDILFIAAGVLKKIAERNNRPVPSIDDQAKQVLQTYTYRESNVAELVQIIERAYFLTEDNIISLEHLFLGKKGQSIGRSVNLLSFGWVRNIIAKGIFPGRFEQVFFLAYWVIIAMLLAAPPEIAKYALILIWGLWWPLTAVFAFWIGRIWCSVCPFSFTMELLQKIKHWNFPVPNLIKKYDYLLSTFLFISFPWLEEVTGMRESSLNTALWLIGLTIIICITGVLFTRHTWCRYICPLGGFIGMASLNGMIEVRADLKTCLNKCTTHDCYRGSDTVTGCPMSQHTGFLDTNNPCKLCLRCVQTCRRDAVQLNLRIPAREVWHLVRVNQGFTIFLGTGLAVLIPLFCFQPYAALWPTAKWNLWFTLAYWGAALVGFIITWLLVRPFRTPFASRRVKLAFAFVPIVVAGNVLYQIRFIPVIKNFALGIIKLNDLLNPLIYHVSLYRMGQASAVLLGAGLTAVSITMVLLRTKKPKSKTIA